MISTVLVWGLILGIVAGVIEAVPVVTAKKRKAKEKNFLVMLCIVNRALIGVFVASTMLVKGGLWYYVANGALVGLLVSLSVAMQLDRYPQVLLPGLVEGGVIAYLLRTVIR
jgi:NADH:ubiquinone oxidoreductase subunit 4 (subunit M)